MTAEEIAVRVRSFGSPGIVCITGGEPTDHDLTALVSVLRDEGQRVHIETSGVRPITGMPLEWITVSPKATNHVQRSGHTLKVVVRPEWSDNESWEFAAECDGDFFHRYLQPMTSLHGGTNVGQVSRMLLSRNNTGGKWALSTQAHKQWGLP